MRISRKKPSGNENEQIFWDFDNWSDFIHESKNRKSAAPEHHQVSRTAGDDFAGTETYDQAYALAEGGWLEGLEHLKPMQSRLLDKLTSLIQRERIQYDVTGNDFDIALVNEGVPECWTKFVDEAITDGVGRRIIRLSFNCSASAGINPDTLVGKGAAMCSLIEALEYAGHRVEVTLHDTAAGGGKSFYLRIPVKAAGEYLDLDRLMFALGHPSTLRRMSFGVQEGNSEFWSTIGSSYGQPIEVTDEDKGDIYIGCSSYGQPQWDDSDSAFKWVCEQLKEQGIAIQD
jgi:hypothetical protein